MSSVGDMYASGSHLAQNFASGISAGVNWVWNAACSVAQAAKDALGFSVPKDGPWSGSEKGGMTSGLHLAQNFAEGMQRGVGDVRSASMMLASAASAGGSYAGVSYARNRRGAERTSTINNYYVIEGVTYAEGSDEGEAVKALFDVLGRARMAYPSRI